MLCREAAAGTAAAAAAVAMTVTSGMELGTNLGRHCGFARSRAIVTTIRKY
jgi:hypothetical protein